MKKIKVKSHYRKSPEGKRIRVSGYLRRKPVYPLKRYEKRIKEKKGVFRRKYGRELVRVLREKGYTSEEIDRVKKYTLVGVMKRLEKEKVIVTKYSKDRKKAFVRGEGWRSVSSLNRALKLKEYWGKVKAYKELMGISVSEARKLLKRMEKDERFRMELKKLVYPTSFKIL